MGRVVASIADGTRVDAFSEFPNTQAAYYARLEEALLKVLGSPKKFDHFGDDD
jgi:hypothetical protein